MVHDFLTKMDHYNSIHTRPIWASDIVENNMHLHTPKEIRLHSAQGVPERDEKLFRKYKI